VCVYRWDELLQQALTLKEEGNVRYRSGNYSGAISKYKLALTALDSDDQRPQLTDQQTDSINRLLVDCHNNLAGRLQLCSSLGTFSIMNELGG